MIGTTQYNLTWQHFEELHPDKEKVFEDLCFSLFKRNLCQEGAILHSDPNHPGIETSPVLARNNKTRISFQSKYFQSKINYELIKNSAIKTSEKYKGKLDKWYLYCNKPLKENCKSFKEIKNVLNKAGIEIQLVTDQEILDQALYVSQICSYYFGFNRIDESWFRSNLEISLENLGNRYNSLFNIDTRAKEKLGIFLREDNGIEQINSKIESLLSELKGIKYSIGSQYHSKIDLLIKNGKGLEKINSKTIESALEWKDNFKEQNKSIFEYFDSDKKKFEETVKHEQDAEKRKEYDSSIYNLDRLLNTPKCLAFDENEEAYIKSQVMIITGDMGTGKTQLLASSAKRLCDQESAVMLLLGQTFMSNDSIEKQIIDNLDGVDSLESLFMAMEEYSFLHDSVAAVFIDAINESYNRDIWKQGINKLLKSIEKFKHIRIVISLRNNYEKLTLSERIIKGIKDKEFASIVHYGFADNSIDKVYEFISNYGIPFSPEYYLQSEMTNPLFLTWFCQCYTGEEQELIDLLINVIKHADLESSKELGNKEEIGVLKPLLLEMIDIKGNEQITEYDLLNLKAWSTYGVNDKMTYFKTLERTGIISSYVKEGKEYFYIGYNLLEDFLIANKILEEERDFEGIKEYSKIELLGIDDNGNITKHGNESVFVMLASVCAMKYGEELIDVLDLINDINDKGRLANQYIESFAWRSSYISYERLLQIIKKYPIYKETLWNLFIENSTKEKSELNAFGLTKLLNHYDISKRDYLWTIVINEMGYDYSIVNLAHFLENGKKIDSLSEEKIYLLLLTFSWMLSSSNRMLRDRISKGMIELLKYNFSMCKKLLMQFNNVDDPYIIQRLYGIVFGAVMKRENKNKDEYSALAKWIYDNIFNKEIVYPDILLRDYARLIIERFIFEYPDNIGEFNIEKINPPYNSEPIPQMGKIDYGNEKFHKPGLTQMLFSMKFDCDVKGIGMYGDFGRYIFQANLFDFLDLDISNIYYYSIDFIINKLGYSEEYFGLYDSSIENYGRHDTKKIERIGKKYQWITLFNVMARITDTYSINHYGFGEANDRKYRGSWELHVRDFDPTLNSKLVNLEHFPIIALPKYTNSSFIAVDASNDEIQNWVNENDKIFEDFPERLILKDENNKEWLSVYSYQENNLEFEKNNGSFSKGEQHIWSIASMYIVPDAKLKYDYDMLQKSNFVYKNLRRTRSSYSLFSREFAWGSGYKMQFIDDCEEEYDVQEIKSISATIHFAWQNEYDASLDESISFYIPAGEIINTMELHEKERDGIYYLGDEMVALDLSIIDESKNELIIRKDVIDSFVEKTGYELFWTVQGEKQYFMDDNTQIWKRREGYFIYNKDSITGNIRFV